MLRTVPCHCIKTKILVSFATDGQDENGLQFEKFRLNVLSSSLVTLKKKG